MLTALLEEETSGWANLANASAAMRSVSGWHWVGFTLSMPFKTIWSWVRSKGRWRARGCSVGRACVPRHGKPMKRWWCPTWRRFLGMWRAVQQVSARWLFPSGTTKVMVAVLDVDSAVKADFAPDDVSA